MNKVIIIGGGVIGLFSAYYLEKAGFEVTILEKGTRDSNCSTGNAGMIVPSHIIPLASPGIVAKGLKWLLSSKSPFYIHPRLDKQLLEWCLLFYRHANAKHVQHSIPYLKALSVLSRSLYMQFDEEHPDAGIDLQKKGLLMLSQTQHAHQEEVEAARLAQKHGLRAEILSPEEIKSLEPQQPIQAAGGVLYPDDAHLSPQHLFDFLYRNLTAKGLKYHEQAEVQGFIIENKRVKALRLQDRDLEADHILLCAGAWSGKVAAQLKLQLPMMGGKGYTFWQENSPPIQQASILVEARVSVSPYGERVRFGGTMEITGTELSINPKRVQGIFESIQSYYPHFKATAPNQALVWSGLRPCSPDGLPYIGKAAHLKNLLIGTGHSMMGLSLAPATGHLLAELLIGKGSSMAIDAFDPQRFA